MKFKNILIIGIFIIFILSTIIPTFTHKITKQDNLKKAKNNILFKFLIGFLSEFNEGPGLLSLCEKKVINWKETGVTLAKQDKIKFGIESSSYNKILLETGTEENEKEDLQIIRQMKSVNCKVLENGFKLKEIEFYFCNCDIDQKDPICVECAQNCHSGPGHILSEKYKNKQICECGIKRHRVVNNFNSNIEEKRYKTTCFFYELSTFSGLNVIYESINTSKEICMFCFNFCVQSYPINEQYFQRKIVNGNSEIQGCSCTNHKHKDIKFIFSQVNEMVNIHKYNFENLTNVHLLNLIFMTDKLKTNIYSSFLRYLNDLKGLITNETYKFDSQIVVKFSRPLKKFE